MRIAKRLFRSFEGSGESGWISLGLAVAALTAYILAFIPPFTPEELRIVELAATPVVVFAWLFGFWGGTAAVIIIPFNAFLFSLVAGETFGTVMDQLQREDLLPAILLLVLGAVLGGLRDVADQMRRESRLRGEADAARRESEERYRFVADTTSDGILTLGRERTILSANPAAARIFGWGVDDMVGEPFRNLIPERVRENQEAALVRYLDVVANGQADYALQVAGPGEDGREITLEITFTASTRAGRQVFTGVVRDATGRHGLDGDRGETAAMMAAMASLEPPAAPTILWIQDAPAGARAVEQMRAGRPGMELLRARTGRDGLESARDRAPDLILLDLHLPDIHGSEVMRRVREDPVISRTPVIILGVEAQNDQGAEMLEAGAQACLASPLDAAELARAVEKVLEG